MIVKGDMVTIKGSAEEETHRGCIFEVLSDPYVIGGSQVVKMKCHETGKYYGGGYATEFLRKVGSKKNDTVGFGPVRRIDDLGRIVIPKEVRRVLRINEGDPLEVIADMVKGEVILRKYHDEGESIKERYEELCREVSNHLGLMDYMLVSPEIKESLKRLKEVSE